MPSVESTTCPESHSEGSRRQDKILPPRYPVGQIFGSVMFVYFPDDQPAGSCVGLNPKPRVGLSLAACLLHVANLRQVELPDEAVAMV